ncbi:hypothetical protein [Acidocella sp.]|jgi:hypothetical protein|uniref:hypothetical protein n=1 Tax=Acidocella sp. TaxID=50710 RepID=UPI002F40B176
MATMIMLKHKDTGIIKKGFYGFSWTTFFFGAIPALFRQDFITFIGAFVVMVILGCITFGIGTFVAMVAWAFMYNKYYTRRLIERGYEFNDSPGRTEAACAALGIAMPRAEQTAVAG